MNLSISIVDKKPKKYGVRGEIIIDDFIEHFDAPLDWWSVDDYKQQWKEGLKRLLDHDTSCLVVTINDPNCRKFIEWWPLYKIDNKIHIQNHIIIEDIYEERIGGKPFTRETCYDFIPRYRSHTDEGNKISEWVIDWNENIK